MEHGAARPRRVPEDDHAVSLRDLDAFASTAEAGGAEGRRCLPDGVLVTCIRMLSQAAILAHAPLRYDRIEVCVAEF